MTRHVVARRGRVATVGAALIVALISATTVASASTKFDYTTSIDNIGELVVVFDEGSQKRFDGVSYRLEAFGEMVTPTRRLRRACARRNRVAAGSRHKRPRDRDAHDVARPPLSCAVRLRRRTLHRIHQHRSHEPRNRVTCIASTQSGATCSCARSHASATGATEREARALRTTCGLKEPQGGGSKQEPRFPRRALPRPDGRQTKSGVLRAGPTG